MLDELLAANKNFIMDKIPAAPKLPRLRLAILTCMDTRLVGLVEPALGLSRGDAKIIKNAGNVLDEGALRSLVVAVYLMGVEEIIVIGHKDCGMTGLNVTALRQQMLSRGVPEDVINEVNLAKWTGTFEDERENVQRVVMQIVHSRALCREFANRHCRLANSIGRVAAVTRSGRWLCN